MTPKPLFVLLICLFPFLIKGQNIAQDTAHTERYPSREYQKSRRMPWALKYEANGMMRDNAYFFNRFGLISEFKIAKNMSLNIATRGYRQGRLLFQNSIAEGGKKAAWQWELSVEPRFNISKNINTFYGRYIGLRLMHESGYGRSTPFYKVLATFGQQRFFYTGIFNNIDNAFDSNIGLGIAYEKNKGIRPSFQINMLQGAILNDLFRKYKPDNAPPDRKKEYQAYIDQNHLFKLDLFNLVTKADEQDIVGEVRLGYEQKIAKSPFSINIEGVISPFRLKNENVLRGGNQVAKTQGTRFGIGLEPRWFYNLKKRIAKGQSGNNLLGSYISFEFLYQNQTINKHLNTGKIESYKANNLSLTPLWGIQQQFSKRIFYDFKLGWGIKTSQDSTNEYFKNYKFPIFADILIGLKLGS
jgi:hypothetical protein